MYGAEHNQIKGRVTLSNVSQRITRSAFFCIGLLPLAGWAAGDPASMRSIVDAAIRPVMAENDVPGIAVAVTMDGKPYFFNYGFASKEKNTPVSERTLFEVGSVSKTFTATLATYAQELGKLSLNDHPGKYLPQLKGSAVDAASLLNLGTYTAGGFPLQFPDAVAEEKQALAYFAQWKADAPPGTQRRYSNPSLGLFGHAAALALDSDYANAVESTIFPAVGMKHSYIRVPDGEMANYAWGYSKANKPGRVSKGPFDAEAYGVKTSTADLIRFVQANIDPSGLDPTMRRAVEGTHIGYFQVGGMVQGLGWEQYPYPVSLQRLLAGNSPAISAQANPAQPLTPPTVPSGPTLFNKTGATGNFSAYVVFVPEKKLGVVLLANKFFPGDARIKAAHAILEQLAR